MRTPSLLKVGDRVRITQDILTYGATKGVEGVIVDVVDASAAPSYRVQVDDYPRIRFFYESDIELVAEVAELPKVREWQVPAEPTDCKRVIATDGTDEVYTHNPYSVVVPWVQASSGRPCTWSEVLDAHDGVREYVQTDYEAAVEFFQKHPKSPLTSSASRDHARAIIAHVIGEK